MSRTSKIVAINKDILQLADNSVWRLAPGHLSRTSEWTVGTDVVIEKSRNAMWQVNLSTPGSKVLVSATPSSGKLVLGSSMRDVKPAMEMHNDIQAL